MAAPRPPTRPGDTRLPQAASGAGFFGDSGNWFSGAMPSIQWGGQAPPQMPAFVPPQGSGTQTQWGGQAPPPLPPPPSPQAGQGSGTSTAWGGPQVDPASDPGMATSDPYKVVNEVTPGKKYSFLDNPGASDALVAFGAAMLKAPDFRQGLGDAALAVNQVAQSYRMPTEQDYAKAKQLGMIARIKSGKGVNSAGMSISRDILYRDADGNTWFDATGPNGEPGLYNQDTGQFTTEGVPGLTRDVYDFGSNQKRRAASKDADNLAGLVQQLPAVAQNVVQFDNLGRLAADPSTGINSDFISRAGRQLEIMLPGSTFSNLDPNNITEFNNQLQQAALAYAQGAFKGQGQVTENERLMIQRAVGEPGTLTRESAVKLFQIMRDAEMRKLQMIQNWKQDSSLRDQYGGDFSAYQTDMLMQATMEQLNTNNAPPAQQQQQAPQNGTTGGGIRWSVDPN